jgi:hypothetical protein
MNQSFFIVKTAPLELISHVIRRLKVHHQTEYQDLLTAKNIEEGVDI